MSDILFKFESSDSITQFCLWIIPFVGIKGVRAIDSEPNGIIRFPLFYIEGLNGVLRANGANNTLPILNVVGCY